MDNRDFERAIRNLRREGMHRAGAELDPREPKCEAPHCRTPRRRGAWVVWARRYPSKRHVLCSDCLEPMIERLAETSAETLRGLELAPLDPHGSPGKSIGFGAFN
jgi:hypothetical protein